MTIRTGAPHHALFDRLGGFDGVDQAVQRLFARLAADASLSGLVPSKGLADARWQVQMLLTDRLGGPMAYDGPDPATLRSELGIGPEKSLQIAAHLMAAFGEGQSEAAALGELRTELSRFEQSLGSAPVVAGSGPIAADPRAELIARAQADVAAAGVADRPLFVLDHELTLVHLNPEAARGLQAVDAELRRAFRLGAADLPGQSILRFHSAPSQLQGLLHDVSRLPKELSWSFGHAVWKARFSVVRSGDGRMLGYAVAWRDESELHRAEAVFQRLRSQAEDLPVPIMYPDPAIEKWFGNAACEHALERLAPYLPFPVNPLDGVPVQLFLPDTSERRALFHDPARLPYKSQIKLGPETIAILVSPIRDENQRYLGPQITWEIVHFTRTEDRAPARAPEPHAQAAPVAAPAAMRSVAAAPATQLRGEARALESAAADLHTLIRLLDLVADQAEGQGAEAVEIGITQGEAGAAQQAEAAVAAALVAVRRAANEATDALTEETRGLSAELQQRVRDAMQRTQLSAEALGKIMTAATGLGELRAALAGPMPPAPSAVEAAARQ